MNAVKLIETLITSCKLYHYNINRIKLAGITCHIPSVLKASLIQALIFHFDQTSFMRKVFLQTSNVIYMDLGLFSWYHILSNNAPDNKTSVYL